MSTGKGTQYSPPSPRTPAGMPSARRWSSGSRSASTAAWCGCRGGCSGGCCSSGSTARWHRLPVPTNLAAREGPMNGIGLAVLCLAMLLSGCAGSFRGDASAGPNPTGGVYGAPQYLGTVSWSVRPPAAHFILYAIYRCPGRQKGPCSSHNHRKSRKCRFRRALGRWFGKSAPMKA